MHLVGFIIRIYHDARPSERLVRHLYILYLQVFKIDLSKKYYIKIRNA